MATLSLRMPDDLKKKAQQLAGEQGVSLNGFINATLAAAIAQQETLAFFSDRLRDVDQETLHERVLNFMRKTRPGGDPSVEEIERAVRG
ncbi:MAG: toxin-antitoxin system HicB family antitoxin [Pirellulaceae bacterium]|nr:toxin-antitoxin system HicB family antitoxin [Pirellulaceae bacterium]